MENIQLVFGLLVLILVGYVYYKNAFIFFGATKVSKFKYDEIKPLFKKIKKGEIPEAALLMKYCSNYKTRAITYQLLAEYNETDLFLKQYFTIEKGAESNLSSWLDFPGDLEESPDEINHLEKIIINHDENQLTYHTFKFRVNEPHWAAKHNWMLGVVGPYFDTSHPYDLPEATYSRINNKSKDISPKEEALWVHQNIYLKN